MSEKRLDIEVYERGLCKSRERARQLIRNGHVTVGGKICTKPAYPVSEESDISVEGDIHGYVGRGGLKLEKALKYFNIDLSGRVCLDIGASTGGFTDCMLQNGASLVFALDVGHSQLDEKLLSDSRVINMEKTNIRESVSADFNSEIEFISADVSFISLKLVLPKINELLKEGGSSVVLVKPQFEAGKSGISKNGIVKDPKVHRQILSDLSAFADGCGFCVSGICVSPVKGGSGNSEYLMYLRHKNENPDTVPYSTDQLIIEALGKK